MKLTKKISAAAATSALALGALFGAAPDANALDGWYHVQSRPYQVWAGVESTPRFGYWQARVQLGSDIRWGAYSLTYSQADKAGWSFSHSAIIYRNGGVAFRG